MKIIKLTIEPTKEQSGTPTEIISEQAIGFFNILEHYINVLDIETIESEIDVLYILIDDKGINNVINYFVNLGITIKIEDVSKQVINGTFQLPRYEENVKDFNSMKEIFFETCVGVDDILDKINELGVESLTELDKKILQS